MKNRHFSDVLVHLIHEEVISVNNKQVINKLGDFQSNWAQYLLDKCIARPLSEAVVRNFIKLLKVIEEIPCYELLANEMWQTLQKCDTSICVVENLDENKVKGEALKCKKQVQK